jgi:hypothetical protein
MICSRDLMKASAVCRPSSSSSIVMVTASSPRDAESPWYFRPRRENSGRFSEKTKPAVCLGVNPCLTRDFDRLSSSWRTSCQAGPRMLVRSPSWVARPSKLRNSRDCSRSSVSDTRPCCVESTPVCSRTHSRRSSSSCSWSRAATLLLVCELTHCLTIGNFVELEG